MKTVVLAVLLVGGGLAATCYVSNYMMGGIEAGLPNGGSGKFAAYHEDNAFTAYLSGDLNSGDAVTGNAVRGAVSANPFAK